MPRLRDQLLICILDDKLNCRICIERWKQIIMTMLSKQSKMLSTGRFILYFVSVAAELRRHRHYRIYIHDFFLVVQFKPWREKFKIEQVV